VTLTVDELTTPLTRQDVEQSIYDILGALGVNTTLWKSGSVVRAFVTASSSVIAALSQLQALIAKSGFVGLSAGDWLTLAAKYVYGVLREDATFATGDVTLVNAGGGVYGLGADDLIVGNASSGKTYRNTGAFVLGAFATLTIEVRATEAGSESSAGTGQITLLVTPLVGVSCSNALPLTGIDAESDPSVQLRCAEKLGSLSPDGPWDAYAFAARTAMRPDGSPIGVTRVRIVKDGFGNVFVYVASAAGAVSGTVGNLTTDLGLVDENIQRLAAPLAVTAQVSSAVPVSQAVTYELWMYNTSARTVAQVQAIVNSALAAFFSAQPVGGNVIDPDPGKIFVDAIRATIASSLPEIFHVVVTVPAADLALAANEVATLGTPSAINVHQVPPSEGARP